jgi:colicin import membrane protein
MKRGTIFSLIFHALILIIAYFGLPSLFQKKLPEEQVVSVELLPIEAMTNVRPQRLEQQEEKKEVKKDEKRQEQPKEQPKPEPKPEAKPVEEKKPEPVKPKESEKVPEEKKPEPKKEKPPEPKDDFESVLKDVSKIKPKQDFSEIEKAFAEDAKTSRKGSKNYDPTKPLSASEIDAIKEQIHKCWNIPAGAKDAKDMQVRVRVSLAEDGSVINVSIADTSRYNSGDPFYVSFADSAVRAVRLCSPLKNLPKEKYSTWRDIELNFDPKEMIY